MSRPTLTLARAPKPPQAPSLALVKKALRLFKGRNVSKAQRHANARKWLIANASLGDRHTLKGGEARWGQPGNPNVAQVFAPRRLSK